MDKIKMAYGNWGAFVYKNGKRQKNHEDQTPYSENDLESGYFQVFNIDNRETYHAVLGSTNLRLCGYKSEPILLDERKQLDIGQFYKEEKPKYDGEEYMPEVYEMEFEYKNHVIRIHRYKDGNMIDLYMKEPNGDVWTSTCGYQYGAGHMD